MKKMKYIVLVFIVLMLSACSFGETTEVKLSNILTEMYELELNYRDVQLELVDIEKKEQANFQRMMELTKDQQEELTKQVDATEKLLEERLVLVGKEADSIKQASGKMDNIKKLIEETKEENDKETLQKIEQALANRFEAYDVLTEQYHTLASSQEELYNLLIEGDAEVDAVQEKVVEVNEQNEVVKQAVNEFNELTMELNKVKEEAFTSLQQDK